MKPMNLANVLFSLKSLKKKNCKNNNKKETETRYVFIINGNTTPKPIYDNHHHSFVKTNTFAATAPFHHNINYGCYQYEGQSTSTTTNLTLPFSSPKSQPPYYHQYHNCQYHDHIATLPYH